MLVILTSFPDFNLPVVEGTEVDCTAGLDLERSILLPNTTTDVCDRKNVDRRCGERITKQ